MPDYTFTIKDTATVFYTITIIGDNEEEAFSNACDTIIDESSVDFSVAGDNIYASAVSYDGIFEIVDPNTFEISEGE